MVSSEIVGDNNKPAIPEICKTTLCGLPDLVQSHILSFLPRLSIINVSLTCRLWREVIIAFPKQCAKAQFDKATVKSCTRKFLIIIKEKGRPNISKTFPIVEENAYEPPRKDGRIEEEQKNEDVQSKCTPGIIQRFDKIVRIGIVKTLKIDAIDITEESIDRIVHIFAHVEKVTLTNMDLQGISNEKARKLLFGMGNTKLNISFTWINARLFDNSFWEKCKDQLCVLELDTVIVRQRKVNLYLVYKTIGQAGIPVIREDKFIHLCSRIPSITFGVQNELNADTIIRIFK
ncbi:hypothetical protein PMAYCL1PPCAC_29322, partial [Pristionchus mayeri]